MKQRWNREAPGIVSSQGSSVWKLRMLAFTLATAIATGLVWGGELVLLLVREDPGLAAMRSARAAGTPYDSRSRSQVVADLRAQGISAVPRLVPAAMLEEREDGSQRSLITVDGKELLPLSGISSATTVLCNETGAYAVYESDEHGFRNPSGSWGSTPIDLALIGDSFTIGECVPTGHTIADRLRTTWPRTLNLGYSGDSPLLELATLVEYGPALEPATTLWLYFENDLSRFDLDRSSKSPLLMRYLERGFTQSLVDRRPAIDLRLRELIDSGLAQPDEAGPQQREHSVRKSLGDRLTSFLLLRRTRRELGRLRPPTRSSESAPDYRLLETILRRARDQTTTWNGELVVVFLPGVWHFDPGSDAPSYVRDEARGPLARQADSLGLRFVDIQEAFERHPDPLSLYSFRGESTLGSPHMNSAGYAITADVLRSKLQQ